MGMGNYVFTNVKLDCNDDDEDDNDYDINHNKDGSKVKVDFADNKQVFTFQFSNVATLDGFPFPISQIVLPIFPTT